MTSIDNFKEVLDRLAIGEHLYLKDRSLVVKKEERYLIMRDGHRFNISQDDFISLYKEEMFFEDDMRDSFIDPLKDEEYYAFRHK